MTFKTLVENVIVFQNAEKVSNDITSLKVIVYHMKDVVKEINRALGTGYFTGEHYKTLIESKQALGAIQERINEKALKLHNQGVKDAESIYFLEL